MVECWTTREEEVRGVSVWALCRWVSEEGETYIHRRLCVLSCSAADESERIAQVGTEDEEWAPEQVEVLWLAEESVLGYRLLLLAAEGGYKVRVV